MHPENNIYIIVYNGVQLTAGKHWRMQMHSETSRDVSRSGSLVGDTEFRTNLLPLTMLPVLSARFPPRICLDAASFRCRLPSGEEPPTVKVPRLLR